MDKVCHFELPYDDKDRMEKFYGEIFGWQFMPAPGGVPYTFAITAEMNEQFEMKETGGINGGTYSRCEDGSKHPVIVIQVESCEDRIKQIEAAGGSVFVPTYQVGDMGMYAQVNDPEGNTIGLWQPLQS